MKKTIKKKKAFTLVELMGVLVIIGVLSAILIPVISNVLKENKEKAYQIQLQNIILAAKNFGSDNTFILPEKDGDSINITLGQLKKSGYLEDSIVNPKTKKEFSNCMNIEIKNMNNDYEYGLDEGTIEVENCNEEFNSDIAISGPSSEYIKNGGTASYILIIKPSDESQVLGYNLDDSKFSLGGATEAKYSVIGDNGIYKITVMGGNKEEDILLTFEEGAITDSNGNNIDTSDIAITTVKVDNTAPTITFETNGSDWTNNASTKIIVSDEKSGGDTSTYKYIYSSVTSAEPANSFSTEEAVSYTSGNGEYYLIASACDRAGNCAKETSNYFKMDTTSPSVPTVTLVYEDNNASYNQTWTNRNVKQIQSSSDDGSGGIYYQYSYDNSTWYSMPANWVIGWDGAWTFYVRACDSVGNCSASAPSYWIGRDTVAPTITSINNGSGGNWTNGNVTISASGSDSGSGMEGIYYRYSSTDSLKNDWTSGSTASSVTGIWSAERNQEVFFVAKDNAGNYSSDTSGGYIRIDKTTPVIEIVKVYCDASITGSPTAIVSINAEDANMAYGVAGGYYYFDAKTPYAFSHDWNNSSKDHIWTGFGYLSSTSVLNLRGIIVRDYANNRKVFSCDCSYSGLYSGGSCTSTVNNCSCWNGTV